METLIVSRYWRSTVCSDNQDLNHSWCAQVVRRARQRQHPLLNWAPYMGSRCPWQRTPLLYILLIFALESIPTKRGSEAPKPVYMYVFLNQRIESIKRCHRLRHRVAYGLMVSDTSMVQKEGWPLVDPLGTESCTPLSVDHRRGSLPPVVHYCQVRARGRQR